MALSHLTSLPQPRLFCGKQHLQIATVLTLHSQAGVAHLQGKKYQPIQHFVIIEAGKFYMRNLG